jgi:hypothetical protein
MKNPLKSIYNLFQKKGSLPQKQPSPVTEIGYTFQRLKWYNTVNDIPQIEDFIQAYATAVDSTAPSRWALQDIYINIVNRDPHLKAKMQERVSRVKNRLFRITDATNQELPITPLFRHKWFSDFLKQAMLAKFYGYSLVELTPSTVPYQFFVSSFDRRQVYVDSSAIVRNYMSADYAGMWRGTAREIENELYYYKRNEELQKYFFEVRFDSEDFGLLEVVACLCILKRHSWGSWDEFEKLFGVPTRIARTPNRDQKTLDNIADWLDRMGNAAWAVFNQDTEIEFHQPNQTDAYNVFDKKIDKVDAQISKLIMGSTLTSDTAANGNRALGEIHVKTADEILAEDIIDMENLVNDQLLPFLSVYWKFPLPAGCKFEFYEKREFNLDQRVKIDEMLLKNGYKLNQQWLEDTYDVKIDNLPTAPAPNNPNSSGAMNLKKKVSALAYTHNLHQYYATDCPCCTPSNEGPNSSPLMVGESEAYNELLNALYNKEFITEAMLLPLAEEYFKVLVAGVTAGFGTTNNPNEIELVNAMKENTAVFAAAKSIDEQKALAALLVGSDGLALSFEDFKTEALKVSSYYKGSWLQAEYNYALRSVRSAKQWLRIEADKEIYQYLRYQTVGDELVRESHRPLDGVTLPVDHPFWKTRKPPIDWNCRCYIEQVSLADNVEITPNDKIPFVKVPEMFQNNPALSKLVYNDSMPYFARATQPEMTQAENIGKKLL